MVSSGLSVSTLYCCALFAVILFCHYNHNVVANIIINAQDLRMMEGTYAWFRFTDFITPECLHPWTATDVYNNTSLGLQHRLTALRAVKLVSIHLEVAFEYIERLVNWN